MLSILSTSLTPNWLNVLTPAVRAGWKEPENMPNDIPSWLSEPCPPWCVADHQETDHPADRVHDSAAVEVPGVILIRVTDADGVRVVPDAVGIYLERYRRVGERQDWVVLGTAMEYLDMSLETARRVRDGLCGLLGGDDG